MRSEGKLDEKEIITAALFPYSTFVRNPWWEVAIPSRTGDASSPEESPEQFAATLQQLVQDSWDMLEKVLDLNSRGLSEILCKDYMAR